MEICSSRYEEIEDIAADTLEDIGYAKFPIDVFELCKLLDIKVIKYSEINRDIITYAMDLSDDGFSYFNKNINQYIIFYNDIMMENRIRFTIMHEIGHIMLEHREHSTKNEIEANIFAKKLLAPLGLIHKLKLDNSIDIAENFEISFKFSQNVINQYKNAIKYPYTRDKIFNSRIVSIFKDYSIKKEIN
ncbi:MAG: ImmA/IrrE family metallo-endopeptidase [Treponema bryantii]|jgi:Zn-dependent peptidase ImmA (M78 family)|nr:ImmA/IrrE family metallo-endopeptidase [Treponema bryantii]